MKIIAITGPAGAGKSTVAAKLAKQIGQCVSIDADNVKHMIVTGFIYDESPEGVKQWQLLGDNIGQLAKNFQAAGYNVIINGYINEPAWENIAKHVKLTYKFLLFPHHGAAVRRDKERHPDFIMGEEAITAHYEYFSEAGFYKDFTLVDSTIQTVDETAKILKDLMLKAIQK